MTLRRAAEFSAALVFVLLQCLTVSGQRTPAPTDPNNPNSPENLGRLELTQYLDNLAYLETAARRVRVAELTNRAQAEARQAATKARILSLIGGLPERTPLNAKVVGTVQGDGFRMEKVIFESQPGFPVTAEFYLPDAKPAGGKFPAIVVTPGHGPTGKTGDYVFSSNFARNGIAVLDYDPIGQGERLQYLNPQTGASLAGAPTGEHGEAGLQPLLIGDAVSRYFIWDAMRAIDYLESRQEVDSNRVGAFGCSGGGTITAMLAGLEPRLKAIGVACFTTSLDTVLPSIGPQDAEQSIPGFVKSGFDIPDWAELAAPRPYAVIATYADMFPFPGAQQSENEIHRFYQLFGAGDRLQFITGPGPHGNILPLMPEIMRFFVKYLKPADASAPIHLVVLPRGTSPFAPPTSLPKDAFQDTSTGQVGSSMPGSETIQSLNLKRGQTLLAEWNKQPRARGAALQQSVREVIGSDLAPDLANDPSKSGYERVADDAEASAPEGAGAAHFDRVIMRVEQGIDLHGRLAWSDSQAKHPAVLLLTNAASAAPGSVEYASLTRKMTELAGAGNLVLAITPRPSPPGTEATKSALLGDYYISGLRAQLVNKSILGLRVDDTIRAVNYLATRQDVDRSHISAEASYHLGLVLMHAAVLDPRLTHVTVNHVLSSYKSLLEAPVPLHAPEDILVGVLKHYDLPDLAGALGDRLSSTDSIAGNRDLSPDTHMTMAQ